MKNEIKVLCGRKNDKKSLIAIMANQVVIALEMIGPNKDILLSAPHITKGLGAERFDTWEQGQRRFFEILEQLCFNEGE